jgi:hypothetical protein
LYKNFTANEERQYGSGGCPSATDIMTVAKVSVRARINALHVVIIAS